MVGRLVRDEEDAGSNPVIPTSFYTGSVDKLRYWEKGKRWYFWCPGCKEEHFFTDGWTFNGDMKSPTIDPSLVVQMTLYGENKVPYRRWGITCIRENDGYMPFVHSERENQVPA